MALLLLLSRASSRENLLGGLHDGSLERVVAEAETLDQELAQGEGSEEIVSSLFVLCVGCPLILSVQKVHCDVGAAGRILLQCYFFV